ncbi:MAG TPA: hypothetical protein VLA04_05070 [Verrucomicrobiae bacterium]|nr:hypothetical protein [Verrucomicrobiae bacterium]
MKFLKITALVAAVFLSVCAFADDEQGEDVEVRDKQAAAQPAGTPQGGAGLQAPPTRTPPPPASQGEKPLTRAEARQLAEKAVADVREHYKGRRRHAMAHVSPALIDQKINQLRLEEQKEMSALRSELDSVTKNAANLRKWNEKMHQFHVEQIRFNTDQKLINQELRQADTDTNGRIDVVNGRVNESNTRTNEIDDRVRKLEGVKPLAAGEGLSTTSPDTATTSGGTGSTGSGTAGTAGGPGGPNTQTGTPEPPKPGKEEKKGMDTLIIMLGALGIAIILAALVYAIINRPTGQNWDMNPPSIDGGKGVVEFRLKDRTKHGGSLEVRGLLDTGDDDWADLNKARGAARKKPPTPRKKPPKKTP